MDDTTVARQSRTQYAQELHRRLVQRDPLAPAEFAEAFLEELVRRLRVRARAVQVRDEAVILDAATDALLVYVQQPEEYDPSRSGLLTYLTMAAYGDLRNMLARESRRRFREVQFEDVEHRLVSRNNVEEDLEEEAFQRYGVHTRAARAAFLNQIADAFSNLRDGQILYLMLSGERRTAGYARILGIQDRDWKVQQRIVKQHKDRISKKLQRLGRKFSGKG